jgi:hypothetical protein
MKLVFIMGDAASGKMTVGQELCKRTGLRLNHNHMTIEPVLEIFGYFHGQAISRIREVIFQEFAATDLPGMVFTYMMAFDMPSEYEYIDRVIQTLDVAEEDVCYAELVAPQDIRLARNVTENRLKNKASNLVKVKVYMRALGAHPDSKEFLSQMNLTVIKKKDTVMFDAAASRKAQLHDWTYLGTLYSGGKVDLSVELEVPVELDTKFQDAVGYLDWQFMVVEITVELIEDAF